MKRKLTRQISRLMLVVFLLGCMTSSAFASEPMLQDQATGSEAQSISVTSTYAGGWVNVGQYRFRLYLPNGWELLEDTADGSLMTVIDPQTGNQMWIEEIPGEGLTMDGILDMFAQMEGIEHVQMLYINDQAFVHYTSPESNVRGFITLTSDAKHALLFKFEPADDSAFTHWAEMIMSTLSRSNVRSAARKTPPAEATPAPTTPPAEATPAPTKAYDAKVSTWAELVAAAKSGKRTIAVIDNLTRGTDEETVVFRSAVTIDSLNGEQYTIDGNGAQIIRIESDTDTPLTGESSITGLSFVNGDAGDNDGGALFVQGDLKAEGCTFSNNAAANGGAIYVTGAVELTDTHLNDNRASIDGGAIFASEGDVTICGGEISNNNAEYDGGGIYALNGDVTVSGGVISNNNAGDDGGGIYALNGDVTVSGGQISNNNAEDDGGGIYAYNGEVSVSGGKISNNNAEDDGGGIYAYDGDVTVTGGEISNNNANDEGGGINAIGVTVSGGVISNNEAKYGGGIFTYDGTVTVSGGEISYNNAEYAGGGIYAEYGDVIVSDGEISDNESEYGGGIYAHINVTVSGGEISNNNAEDDGGGIYAHISVTVSGGEISNNNAEDDGGGVFAYGDVTVSGGEISNNNAENGGGVYTESGSVQDSGNFIHSNTPDNVSP